MVERKEGGTEGDRKERRTEGETATEKKVKKKKAGTNQSRFTCLEDSAGWMGC